MNITKSDFVAIKYKYLALKFQDGGFTNSDEKELTKAALALIKCNKETSDSKLFLNQNIECNENLATIASIFLSIVYSNNINQFNKLINQLIDNKINEKYTKIDAVKYVLDIIYNLNKYLSNIGTKVSLDEIVNKNDLIIKKEDGSKIINQFIYQGLHNITPINIIGIFNRLQILSPEEKNKLKIELDVKYNHKQFSKEKINVQIRQLKNYMDKSIKGKLSREKINKFSNSPTLSATSQDMPIRDNKPRNHNKFLGRKSNSPTLSATSNTLSTTSPDMPIRDNKPRNHNRFSVRKSNSPTLSATSNTLSATSNTLSATSPNIPIKDNKPQKGGHISNKMFFENIRNGKY